MKRKLLGLFTIIWIVSLGFIGCSDSSSDDDYTTYKAEVGLGFVVLCLSKFVILRYLGVLVAIVMFTSSFLAMTIIPGILNLSDPKFIKPEEKE